MNAEKKIAVVTGASRGIGRAIASAMWQTLMPAVLLSKKS